MKNLKVRAAVISGILMAAILFPGKTFSQNKLSGIVVNENTGEKIQGAVVSVENSFAVAITDANGNFIIPDLKKESVKIRITHLAYENYSAEVPLSGSWITISLKPRIILADEVNIVATRAGDKSAMAFTNINKEEIEKQNLGQDLPYLISLTPSVVVTSDAGAGVGYTGIRIRGSDATRVNVTINGIPVNDAEAHQVYWVDLPDFASSVDNIQVQRGIGTSTNGAGAFGGSVNIQSSKISFQPFASVSNSYGSFNTMKHTVLFGTGLVNKKISFEGRLSKITSDGYIDRAASDLKSFYLSGGYYHRNSSIRVIIFSGKEKTYQSWYGVSQDSLKTNRTFNPAGIYTDNNGNIQYYSNQTDNYQQDYYQLLYSRALNTRWNLNAALHFTKGKGYYEEYAEDQMRSDYNLPLLVNGSDTIERTDLIRRRWLENNFYGFTYSANYTKNKLELTIGGAGNQYKGKHFSTLQWLMFAGNVLPGTHYADDDATKNDFNVFTKLNYDLTDQLNIFVDLQFRKLSYAFLGFNNDLNSSREKVNLEFFNPKAGISFNIKPNQKIYGSFSIGHREPVRDDYVASSPLSRPKPEEMQDVEAGYKLRAEKFTFAANYYFMNYKDQLILTGKINDVGAYIRQNVSNSYRTGIELEVGYVISSKLNVKGNATYSRNKIQTFYEFMDDYDNGIQILSSYKNTDIAFSPSILAAGILGYTPFKNLDVNFITRYVGKQYLDNTSNGNRSLKAYALNDLRLNYSWKLPHTREIRIAFFMNNIFNNMYESNGYTYSYKSGGMLVTQNFYYPQAGRNFLAGATLKF